MLYVLFFILVALSRPTLCDPMDCSPPGFSVYGILQARILEWVAIPFSRGSYWPRDRTQVSCIAGRFFTVWATREVQYMCINQFFSSCSSFSFNISVLMLKPPWFFVVVVSPLHNLLFLQISITIEGLLAASTLFTSIMSSHASATNKSQ